MYSIKPEINFCHIESILTKEGIRKIFNPSKIKDIECSDKTNLYIKICFDNDIYNTADHSYDIEEMYKPCSVEITLEEFQALVVRVQHHRKINFINSNPPSIIYDIPPDMWTRENIELIINYFTKEKYFSTVFDLSIENWNHKTIYTLLFYVKFDLLTDEELNLWSKKTLLYPLENTGEVNGKSNRWEVVFGVRGWILRNDCDPNKICDEYKNFLYEISHRDSRIPS